MKISKIEKLLRNPKIYQMVRKGSSMENLMKLMKNPPQLTKKELRDINKYFRDNVSNYLF